MAELVKNAPIPTPVPIQPGPWMPDTPSPSSKGLTAALNLIPKSNGLYGPELAAQTFSTQSTALFSGANGVHGKFHSQPSVSGVAPRFYVGTFATAAGASKILSRPEQGAWEDLSRSGGYTVTAQQPWDFANFGNRVCAANRGVPLQVSEGGSADFADVPNAPQFTAIATVEGFLMGVNYIDNAFGGGSQPFGVAWSAAGDPNLPVSAQLPAGGWPEPGTDFASSVRSGVAPLVGGGELRAIVPGIGGAAAIIIAERKMWRVTFVGSPKVFQFDEVESDAGTNVAGSIGVYNETFFYRGHNDFYWHDGQNAIGIGQGAMSEFFESDISLAAAFGRTNAIEAAIDPINKNYVVSYRSSAAGSDRNDKILRYNWKTQQWSNSEQALDTIGNLNNDSSATDAPRMFGMGTDFEVKTFDGATLETTLTHGETYDITGNYTQIHSFLALIDTNQVEAAVQVRDQLNQTVFETTLRGLNNQGLVPFDLDNVSGRFYTARIRVPAGATWNEYQGGIYYTFPASSGTRSGQGGP